MLKGAGRRIFIHRKHSKFELTLPVKTVTHYSEPLLKQVIQLKGNQAS